MADVSVIIPTLDEVDSLPRTLASVTGQRGGAGVETIVVDGGSTDGTRQVARQADRVIDVVPAERARQLNAGAAAACSPILIFLHADTTLGPDAVEQIVEAAAQPGCVGGACRLRIDGDDPGLRLIERGVNLRSRLLGLPYGDQAIFIRRAVFEALGGFRRLPIMEDLDLVMRVRRRGRLALLPAVATTSDRRWRANGLLRTTLMNGSAAALFQLGANPAWIRRWYDRGLRKGDCRVAGPGPGAAISRR